MSQVSPRFKRSDFTEEEWVAFRERLSEESKRAAKHEILALKSFGFGITTGDQAGHRGGGGGRNGEGSGYCMFTCKTEGCENKVLSNKGLGAYCSVEQDVGLSHRELHMREQRKANPDFGRKNKRVDRDGHEIAPRLTRTRKIERHADPADKFWLTEVKEEIEIALQAVEKAQAELEDAKYDLRVILARAVDKIA